MTDDPHMKIKERLENLVASLEELSLKSSGRFAAQSEAIRRNVDELEKLKDQMLHMGGSRALLKSPRHLDEELGMSNPIKHDGIAQAARELYDAILDSNELWEFEEDIELFMNLGTYVERMQKGGHRVRPEPTLIPTRRALPCDSQV